MEFPTKPDGMPRFSLALLAALLVLTPYAMSLPLMEGVGDNFYAQRVVLVLLGLCTTLIAGCELIAVLWRKRSDILGLTAFVAAFLACAVIGWRSFPYWATGIYRSIGAFGLRDHDPKSFIPMIWIGELWRLPVLLLYLVCYAMVPLLMAAATIALWRRRFTVGAVCATCTGLVAIFMFRFSPDYITWLID
jgi:hypothetical protein